MKPRFFLLLLLLAFSFGVVAQSSDEDILFSVAEEQVPLSEFMYIYQKNLGKQAQFSEKNINEYLDLYVKFKLKVKEAKSMKLDTQPSFMKEMKGYREQLAKSYLVDKEVNEKLLKEAFERMQKDKKISHILINFSKNNTNGDEAKKTIDDLYNKLKNGESFVNIARKYSNDKYSGKIGGSIGWVTAMLPNGFYNFENAIYGLKVGEFSKPVKSDLGYHIILLEDERPAKGEIEASHILIREKGKGGVKIDAKSKIDSIYTQLKAGADFNKMARQYSVDKKTANKGGYLGFFGINKYSEVFENKAFDLKKDGDISEPFKSSAGWHIIKRISRNTNSDYDKVKRSLSNKISENERYQIARIALIERIKYEGKYSENTANLTYAIGLLDNSFYSFKWKQPKYDDKKLFEIGGKTFMIKDFYNYCDRNQRERLRFNKKSPVKVSAKVMFDKYVDQRCISYEEEHLEEKYPDFKFLMREYTEGNLLFEIMEKEIWNKASKDSTGLKEFFKISKNKYYWEPRAEIYTYTINSADEKLRKKIVKYAKKKSHKKLIKKFNKKSPIITFTTEKVEKSNDKIAGIPFKKGKISEPVKDDKAKTVTFTKIEKILPASEKTLDEAKGYIIADYQEYLEEQWIEKLRQKYPVKVNKKVLNKIIK